MTEEDFPRSKRGSKKIDLQDNEKEVKCEVVEKEKTNLKRPRTFADESPFAKRRKTESVRLENPLQNETLCQDLTVLACVRQAHDYYISLSLPGNHIASLPITNISKAYSMKLKEIAQQEEDHQLEDFCPAEDLFKSGMLIPVVIKEITDNRKTGKRMLTTSCDPALINHHLPLSALQDGMLLIGNISSVEDHGYKIDLGIKGLQAFLKAGDAESYIKKFFNDQQLSVGMPLWCVIHLKSKDVEKIKDTRVVNVSLDPHSVQQARIPQTANLNAVLPGMKINVVVESVSEHGLTVKFHSFQGIIHCSHLPRTAFSFEIGTELTAVILYVHPESKVIHLSALAHIENFEGGPIELFQNLNIGDKRKATIQRTVRKKGLYVKLTDSHKGFAAMSQLTDASTQPDITKFKRSQEVECRVMGFNYMEGLALVTLKESILSQKYLTVNDIKPGDLVEGTITEVLSNGILVMLSRKIFSFISSLHLADVPIKHPEKKFEEGQKVKCRVMKVDSIRSKVILTHKKSMLKMKYPLITEYSDIKPYMELEGYISFIGAKALHVNFFNNVKGYVLCKDMSTERVVDPSALFYIGQVVRCRVVFFNVDEKKLRLSFNLGVPRPERKQEKEHKEEVQQNLSAGMLLQARVLRIEQEAFRVSLLPNKIQAILPFCHLSDYHELQELRKMYLKPGQTIAVTFFSKRLGGIVTMKESFLQAASDNQFAHTFEDLESGMLLPGVIKNHQDYGVFLELAGGFLGLCPMRTLTELQPKHLTDVFPPGQSVITRISKIDKAKTRFLGSLRKEECFEGGVESSLKLLSTFLKSKYQIMAHVFEENENLVHYSKLHLGSIVKVTVTSSFKKGILCDAEPGMKALATQNHFGDIEPVVGKKYDAVVLCVDALAPCLELSLDASLVRLIKCRKDNSKSKVKPGQIIKADLQLIKPDYMVMSLRGHAAGAFVHIPTKQIINDISETPAYKEGMFSEVVIKEVNEEFAIAVLKMNDPEVCHKKKKLMKAAKSHNVKIGAVLEAKVKNVHKLQMNIITEDGVQGRVHITEATDNPVEGKHPLHRYQPHDSIKVKVIGLRDVKTQSYLPISHPKADRTLLECTMRESKMELTEEEDLFSTSLNVSIGDEMFVYILQIASNKEWVQVSPVHQGWIDFFHLSNDVSIINDMQHHFKIGRTFKAKVMGTDNDNKIILSLLGTEKELKTGSEVNARITGVKPMECLTVKLSGSRFGIIHENPLKTDCLGQFIRCCVNAVSDSQIYELSTVGERPGALAEKEVDSKVSSLSQPNTRKRKHVRKSSQIPSEEQVDSGVEVSKMSSDSESEKHTGEVTSVKNLKTKSTLSIEGFSWSGDLKPQEDHQALSDDDEDDDDSKGIRGQTTGSKVKRKRKREEERAIQQYERNQLEGGTDLQSPSDFDRMVLQSPNSSVVWLRYMAYHMELGEVEKARGVAEKALSTIAFREEQEKKNVWLAYLNLETMYGNNDDVKKVLERAVAYNDPVEIYLKMCDIYVGANKVEEAEQLFHVITRKFKKDKSIWKAYSQFLFKAGRLQVARNLLQRCLNSLDKKDHVEVISKFANLEFGHGDAERGRTMFENLIASYPGRTDIWSVYIDMVTKAGDIDSARNLLERAVKQKLNTKKLSFLVQKFIKFEETYGTEEKVENVKHLAVTLFDS